MMSIERATEIFKALGDENRIRILTLLKDGELCALDLLKNMDFSQPTLSHHMKILVSSGLVSATRLGKWCHYSINSQIKDDVLEVLDLLLK